MDPLTKCSVKLQKRYELNPLKNEDRWCISDFALDSNDRIVLSGSKHSTKETFIKVFSIKHSSEYCKPKCLYSRDFNRQENPEQWRLVSFSDSFNLVTCYDNQVEKISIKHDKILQSKKLANNTSASCISVRGTQTFIGFNKSSSVVILNSDLHITSTITFSALQNGWPIDLMLGSDTILVCSFGCVPKRVHCFEEKDGQLLREYTNPKSDEFVPLSLTASAEADLMAVLWNSPPRLTIHSYSHSHCLVVADVEPAERIRSVGHDKLVMVDEEGLMRVYQMGRFFTMHNLKATLSCLLSSDDCQELGGFFGLAHNQSKQADESTDSPSGTGVEDDQSLEDKKLGFLECLEKNKKIHSGDVTDLIRAVKQLEKGRTILDPLEAYEKYGSKIGEGDLASCLGLDSGRHDRSQEEDADETLDNVGINQELNEDVTERGDYAGATQRQDRDVDERDRDAVAKRKHSRDDRLFREESFKRKRIDSNHSDADNGPSNFDQVEFLESIKRAVKEAIEPLKTEIQSLKQQNDLMMCYLRTQPFQHSSSSNCTCVRQCQAHVTQSCCQVHTHACNHLVQQPCSNIPTQSGNGVPSSSQPNLPQQQHGFAPVPFYQPVIPHPQMMSYPNSPFPFQPHMQLPPPQANHLQIISNPYPNLPMTIPPPNCGQPPLPPPTVLQPPSHPSSQHPMPNSCVQTPARANTGIVPTNQMQPYHTPVPNGTSSSTDNLSSPPSLQSSSNVLPPQSAMQDTTPRQLSLASQNTSAPTRDHHKDTQPSITSTPNLPAPHQEEVLNLPDVPGENSQTQGQGSSQHASPSGQNCKIPTQLSELPKNLQLKLSPFVGQKNDRSRQNVIKLLIKYFFTHDERLRDNTSGTRGYKQMRMDKLYGMRDLVFKLSPLNDEEDQTEKQQRWIELCRLIDVQNRHYRNELKRAGLPKKKKGRLTNS